MRNFIRLQLKLKWGFNRNNSKRNAVMTAIAALLAVAIVLALVWGLAYVLNRSLQVSAKRLSVMFITVLTVCLTVVATGSQINRLYRPGDLHITARFPLSPFKVFVSYLIINYIDLAIYSAILFLPVMMVFGWAVGCITFVYVLGVLLGTLLLPLLPFGLSVFLALPIMYVDSLLKKHNVVKLISFIVLLVGLFALYYYILTVLAEFFIHRNWEEGTLGIWESVLQGLDSYYNPAYYLGNVVFFQNFWLGFGAYLGASVLLIGGGVAVAKLVYRNIRTKQLESGAEKGKRVSRLDNYADGRAILRHTFLEIMHTKAYSYFYLGVAISTPVMVFFCNRLVQMVGEAQIGQGINFGVAMLVISVFMALIGSYASTILSVEGKNFYITKLIPVPYRKQLCLKSTVNIAVSLGALLVSVIVMVALQFISAVETVVLTLSQILFAVGLVLNGINLNLANPNLKPKANGEAEEINITYMLLIGLVIAALYGMFSILMPKLVPETNVYLYLINIGIGLIYAAVNFFVFWFTADRKYKKIEA